MASTKGIRAGKAFVELFADNTKLVRGLRLAEAKVKQFGNSLKHIGMQMTALGSAMLAPLAASAKVFGKFEKNMKMVSTMLDNPMQNMGKFSKGVREMAMEFGESTGTLAKGLYDILSASVAPANAMEALRAGAKAGIAGISDTATAINGLLGILNAYGMSAKQATNIADVMFTGVRRGIYTFAELADNIGRVAPMARSAGMSFQTMIAAISTMTRQKLSMDQSVTRLANILKQAPEASKDFVGLISKYVGKDLGAILVEFPEIRAATGISALAGDLKGLVTDINLMNNAAGAADVAFQKMTGGLLYEMNRIWAVVKDTAIAVGEALAPELKKLAGWLIKNGGAVSEWISQNKGLVVSFVKLAAGIIATGVALVVLGTVVNAAGAIIGVFATALSLLFTPLGLILSTVVGLGAAIMHFTNTSGAALRWFSGTFDTLKNDALTAFQGISDALAAGSITQAAKVLWLTLKLEWIRGTTFLKNIWDTTIGGMAKAIVTVAQAIVATPLIAINLLESALFAAAGTFLKAFMGAIDLIAKGFNRLRGLVDWDFHAGSANAAIDKKAKERNKSIQDSANALGEKHRKRLDFFGDINKKIRGNIDNVTNDEIATNESALTKARQEWQAAIDEARKMRENAMQPDAPDTPDAPPPPGMPEAPGMPQMPMLPNIGEALKKAVFSSKGTFSAFAAYGLGVGSSVEDRTAKATEQTAKNTKQMLKEIQDAQLEFT